MRKCIDIFARLTEKLLSYFNLNEGSHSYNLMKHGIGHIITPELIEESERNGGYLIIPIPFSFLPSFIIGKIKNFVVITDHVLAKKIGCYTTDVNSREPFKFLRYVLGTPNLIITNTDNEALNKRRTFKETINNPDIMIKVRRKFIAFCKYNCYQKMDIEKELTKFMARLLGEQLLGIHIYPKNMDRFIELITDLDEAVLKMEINKLAIIEQKLRPFSDYIHEKNKKNIESNEYIVMHLLNKNEPVENLNIGSAFLITMNLIKLTCISIIFLATNPHLQNDLRKAFNEDNTTIIRNFYYEFCRLYIPTSISRYSTASVTIDKCSQHLIKQFPANSMFYIAGSAIRLNETIYENPTMFNPARFNDSDIKMNTVKLMPFGIGARQCPASSGFSENFWRNALEVTLKYFYLECNDPLNFEDLHLKTNYIKLKEKYMVHITPIKE